MYIQNQIFSDRDTLLEILFDFELGESTAVIQKMQAAIETVLKEDAEYQKELQKMESSEDREEFSDEVKKEFLANMLLEKFSRFEVKDRKWYGLDAADERVLLSGMENFV